MGVDGENCKFLEPRYSSGKPDTASAGRHQPPALSDRRAPCPQSARRHQPPAPPGTASARPQAPHPQVHTSRRRRPSVEHRVRSPPPSTASTVRTSTRAADATGHRVRTSTPASGTHRSGRRRKAHAMESRQVSTLSSWPSVPWLVGSRSSIWDR